MSYRNTNLSFRGAKWVTPVLVVGAPIAYLLSTHAALARKVDHKTIKGVLTPSTKGDIESIPAAALAQECAMVYDLSSKSVPTSSLPALDLDELITFYLRHTMQRFAKFPQAYLLYLTCTPAERETFKPAYLKGLNFREGDVVNGVYTVAARSQGKVEFQMKTSGKVNGRLSIAIKHDGNETIFSAETVMWKPNGEKAPMPLESKVVKWLHEFGSWSLLESGTKYLATLKKTN